MTADVETGRCPRCQCSNCGGQLDQHTETSCGCEDCQLDPADACSLQEFTPPERIGMLAEHLSPLLASHLNARTARRCLAVAHAAHHALLDYDRGDTR